jgi:hypothetical protein
MLPLKQIGSIANLKDYRIELPDEPKFHDWAWLIAFFVICNCNGWFLKESSASLPIVICFAIFPLAYLLYEIFNNTWILAITVIISWGILAFAIGNLDLPHLSPIAIGLYIINILFFAFVLMDTLSDNGFFMLIFVVIITLLLFKITDWERILRLIWFCNLMLIANNAGTRLNKYLQSFFAAMMTLSGTAAFGLAIGWILGGFT